MARLGQATIRFLRLLTAPPCGYSHSGCAAWPRCPLIHSAGLEPPHGDPLAAPFVFATCPVVPSHRSADSAARQFKWRRPALTSRFLVCKQSQRQGPVILPLRPFIDPISGERPQRASRQQRHTARRMLPTPNSYSLRICPNSSRCARTCASATDSWAGRHLCRRTEGRVSDAVIWPTPAEARRAELTARGYAASTASPERRLFDARRKSDSERPIHWETAKLEEQGQGEGD